MTSVATLQFLGAAGTVTGSKHLVQVAGKRILLDCGLFQGLKALRLRNWEPPPFTSSSLDAVVLSHAHIDHSGALPLIVRRGFAGPVYCTAATADLLRIMLLDAAHLQEEHAERANRYGYTKHRPALPLYTVADAQAAIDLLVPNGYDSAFQLTEQVTARYRHAGHILGSASVELAIDEGRRRVVFSGDLGRWDRPILKDPEAVPAADLLLVEATYGDRTHPPDPTAALARIVRQTAERGGVLLVPAFAVGRTQELLWRLRELESDGLIPALPVYVDSPMAINVTDVYRRHPEEHDLAMEQLANNDGRPLSPQHLHLARSSHESKAINDVRGPFILISASGMATGGRILHHLKRRLPDQRSTVLLAGFQAAGTRGRALQDGAGHIRIFGRDIEVRATIATLAGLSAHADRDELLRWLRGFHRPPTSTYLIHAEPSAAAAFAETIQTTLRWRVQVAQDRQEVTVP